MPPSDRRRFLALTAAALGATAGCLDAAGDDPTTTSTRPGTTHDPSTDDPTTAAPAPRTAVESVARGNADFGFDVLDALAATDSDANYLFSPYSAGVALAMTYAGAGGETRDQMRDVLRFDVDGLHDAWRTLSDRVTTNEGSESTTTTREEKGEPFVLRDANAVWGQEGYPWRASFTDLLAGHYGAGVREVDFESDPEAARMRINEWTAEHTEGTIEKLFEKGALTTLTRMVLANAVYFRANWRHQFDEDATEPREFTRLDGSTVEASVMSNGDRYPYHDGETLTAVALPYVGDAVEMLVVLPDGGAFESVRDALDGDRLAGIAAALEKQEGTVSLPTFGYGNTHDLAGTLSDLGMPRAFGEDADFTGMAEGDAGDRLLLDDVVQRTHIEVDEKGTEAAAATGVEAGLTSAPADPFEFVANRPFCYAVRHRETGAVLFLGQVTDPTA